jgi:hypothetical protein
LISLWKLLVMRAPWCLVSIHAHRRTKGPTELPQPGHIGRNIFGYRKSYLLRAQFKLGYHLFTASYVGLDFGVNYNLKRWEVGDTILIICTDIFYVYYATTSNSPELIGYWSKKVLQYLSYRRYKSTHLITSKTL